MGSATWSEEEVERRLGVVREKLLYFLNERHRLEWFETKVRWRLSRKTLWPGSPEQRDAMLDAAVGDDASVDAFRAYLQKQQRTISDAIEQYNYAVRRLLEEQHGVPVNQFPREVCEELHRRRITFQGIRDELKWRAAELRGDSGPELIPELLSLRLAILTRDVRDEIFGEIAATIADQAADHNPDLTPAEKELVAFRTDLRLRCLDQYNVAKLLARNYEEARRLMGFDELVARYKVLAGAERDDPGAAPTRPERIDLLREVLRKYVTFLEEIFPASQGTHERVSRMLREAPPT